MVPSLTVVAPVPALHDDRQVGIGELRPRGDGQGSSVQAVEDIGVQIVGCLGGLTDTGDEEDLMGLKPAIRQGLFDCSQDAEVAASRTPGRLILSIICCSSVVYYCN